jgi:flagellar hook-associated protein 1 FlgK
MADLLQIGLSGIHSSQANLTTTGHNISNVNTEGYSRQEVDVTNIEGERHGSYFVGQGSMIASLDRAYDQFAFTDNIMNTSINGYNTLRFKEEKQLDMLLSNESTAATGTVLNTFSSLNSVVDSPNLLEARTVFLESASNMVSQYNNLYHHLEIQYNSVNVDIENSAASISELADSIADLNIKISLLTNKPGIDNPNDLLDKRNKAITKLSELVNVSVIDAHDGMVNIYIGSGQGLVMGDYAQKVIAVNGEPDPSRKEIALQIKDKSIVINSSKLGGKVAALFDVRKNDIELAFNQLGQNVIGLAHSLNEQHKQGETLNGEIGKTIFNDLNDIDTMASRVLSHTDGKGTAKLSVQIDNLSELTPDEYKLVVDEYDAVAGTLTFTVTNQTTGKKQSLSLDDLATNRRIDIPESGFSIGFDVFSISDPLMAGKEFTLRPTRLAAQQMKMVETNPENVAAADAEIKAVIDKDNKGDAKFRISAINDKLNPLYMDEENPLTIKVTNKVGNVLTYDVIDKNGIIITDPSTNSRLNDLTATIDPLSGKAEFSVGGVVMLLEKGIPEIGDSVNLNFNETGEGDNRNMLAMADLQNTKIMKKNKATFQDVYSGMVSELGIKTDNADVAKQSSDILLNQSFERIQTVSGVNMDEEAANLLLYQQHYSAAARVITVAGELFNTILQSAR